MKDKNARTKVVSRLVGSANLREMQKRALMKNADRRRDVQLGMVAKALDKR